MTPNTHPIHWLNSSDTQTWDEFQRETAGATRVDDAEELAGHVAAGTDVWVWTCPYYYDIHGETVICWALSWREADALFHNASDEI